MKNKLKLTVVAAFSIAAGIALSTSSVPTASAEAPSGRQLYIQNCTRCHGADGKSQTAKGKELEADDISGGEATAKVIRVVRNGRGDMPAFGKRLTAKQIASIAGYVHSL